MERPGGWASMWGEGAQGRGYTRQASEKEAALEGDRLPNLAFFFF